MSDLFLNKVCMQQINVKFYLRCLFIKFIISLDGKYFILPCLMYEVMGQSFF